MVLQYFGPVNFPLCLLINCCMQLLTNPPPSRPWHSPTPCSARKLDPYLQHYGGFQPCTMVVFRPYFDAHVQNCTLHKTGGPPLCWEDSLAMSYLFYVARNGVAWKVLGACVWFWAVPPQNWVVVIRGEIRETSGNPEILWSFLCIHELVHA